MVMAGPRFEGARGPAGLKAQGAAKAATVRR
jgi:hypothetical protein